MNIEFLYIEIYLSEKDLISDLPDAANASITSYNDTLKIKMQIRKVYPLPNCTVYVGVNIM